MALRKKSDGWPKAGQTTDNGIGSRAKTALQAIDEDDRSDLKSYYDKVVKVVSVLSDEETRAVCLAACSTFSWTYLLKKAETKAPAFKTVSEEVTERIEAEVGTKRLKPAEYGSLYAKHEKIVKQKRKKVRYERESKMRRRKN